VKLAVPDKLRDRVAPRRSLPDFVNAPTEKSATRELARLEKAYLEKGWSETPKSAFAAGLDMGKEAALKKQRREAHGLFCKPSLDVVRAMSVESLAVAERMAHHVKHDADLTTVVAAVRGVCDAVTMMTLSLDLDLESKGNFSKCIFVARKEGDTPCRYGSDWLPLRHAVCAAAVDDYARAKKIALAFRKKLGPIKRSRLAYAFPDEPWSLEDVRLYIKNPTLFGDNLDEVTCLYGSCDDVDIAKRFIDDVPAHAFDYALHLPSKDALDILGAALPPLLVKPKYGALLKGMPREVAMAITLFPTTQAAKLLAPYFGNAVLGPLVATYFQDHPELRDALADKAKARLHTGERSASGPIAKDDEVPRVLRERPWKRSPSSTKTIAIVLSIPKDIEERIELTAAERELQFENDNAPDVRDMTRAELAKWHAELKKKDGYLHVDWETIYRKMGHGVEYARVPEDEGLRAWNSGKGYANGTYVEWLTRHGTKAIDGFVKRDWVGGLSYTEVDDEPMMGVLAHIVSPRIAPIMARVVARRKNFRRPAMAWLMKHAELAAVGLIPDALGKAGEARDDAELSLGQMAQKGAREAILAAAKTYGDDARHAIDSLVSRDPLEIDATVPKAPDFLRRANLPAVLTKTATRLPDETIDALLEMLRIAPLDPPYAGVAMLRESCDEASLAAFARELAEQWLLAGANGRFDWMLFALAHFPSPENTRRAGQLARDWARRDRKKALRACMMLAGIGDDLALLHLGHVAATSRFDDLRDAARGLLDEAAEARGLSRDELDDRIVPDLDLSKIPFGSRKLTISLDEGLRPFVVGEKQFPRSKTPEEKTAKARFDALKADAAAIADRQIRRFEAAMVSGREWSAADFETYVARHPFLRHVARRVVWESVQNTTFRVTEDGTYADAKDRPVTLAKDARVRVPHPARMREDERVAWSALFADYRIAQPFEQLGRAVATRVTRDAFKAPATKVLGTLESRGWRRNDRGHVTEYLRALLSGGEARIALAPGISMEDVKNAGDQTITGVELPENASNPVDLAEITRDLDALL
jgi:hypothetical protein